MQIVSMIYGDEKSMSYVILHFFGDFCFVLLADTHIQRTVSASCIPEECAVKREVCGSLF